METIKYLQRDKIAVPRWEIYMPQGEYPDERFVLEDAKGLLERWGIKESSNNVWGDPWTYEMTEAYRFVKDSKRSDRDRVRATNMVIAEHVQNQFSRALMDSMKGDFSLISRAYCPAYNTYFLRENDSKGIIFVEEPPVQYMAERNPDLDFKIKATEEIDLGELVKKINEYLDQNWHLPK